MRDEFRNLRLKQLDRALSHFVRLRRTRARKKAGFARSAKQQESLRVKLPTLKTSRQLPVQLEKAEAEEPHHLKKSESSRECAWV